MQHGCCHARWSRWACCACRQSAARSASTATPSKQAQGHHMHCQDWPSRQADKCAMPRSKPTAPSAHMEAPTAGRGSSHPQGRTRDVAALLAGLHARFVPAAKVLARRPSLGSVGMRVRRCASGHSVRLEGGNYIPCVVPFYDGAYHTGTRRKQGGAFVASQTHIHACERMR